MRKKRNAFVLTLGEYSRGSTLFYDGCKSVTQWAYSPEQAVFSLLEKSGLRGLGDDYFTAWKDDKPEPIIRIEMDYNGGRVDLKCLPRQLRELETLQRYVSIMTGRKKESVKNMSYYRLFDEWNRLKSRAGQIDMFPVYRANAPIHAR